MPREGLRRIGTSVLTNGNALVDVIEHIGFGLGPILQVCIGGLIAFISGVEVTVVSSTANDIGRSLELAKSSQALPSMSSFFGASVGNIVAGPVGDAAGRRLPILCSLLGVFIFQCASAAASNLWLMVVLFALLGLSLGIGQPPCAVLASEIVPAEKRIHASFIGNVIFVFGEVYAVILIWVDDPSMKDLAWRWLLIVGAIPALIGLFIAYFFLYESPFYLVLRHDYDDARKVLDGLREMNGNPDVPTEFEQPRKKLQPSKTRTLETDSSETWENLRIIFGRNMCFTTFVVCFLKMVCSFTYYGGMYALPQVLPTLNTKMTPVVTLLLGALAEIPGCMVGILVGMYMSRKGSMVGAQIATAITMILFSMAAYYLSGQKASSSTEIVLQSSLMAFRVVTSIMFVILPLYSVEIYPTRARTMGMSVTTSFGRLGGFCSPMVFELLSSATGNMVTMFWIIAGLNLASAGLVCLLPLETKGKALSDHDDEMEPLRGQ